MSEPMNGKTYFRALGYALRAVPKGDTKPDLQHVTFIGPRIVGADGRRWHVGYLPLAIDEVLSVTRSSAQELILALDYAHRASKRRSGTFSVQHRQAEPGTPHHPGIECVIEYGATAPIVHQFQGVDCGGHPKSWQEPVPIDAPLRPVRIDCGAIKQAISWWKSWDKDIGYAEMRGGEDGGPIRVDILAGGDSVATAFLLPEEAPDAEIRDTMPLFEGVPVMVGRSNLALDMPGDGEAYSPEADDEPDSQESLPA